MSTPPMSPTSTSGTPYRPPVGMAWQVPPAAAREDYRLGWLKEANQEGNAWLKSQRGYSDWSKSMAIISGKIPDPSRIKSYQSQLNTNRLKRNIREVVSVLSDIRPMWGYNSDNSAYVDSAGMMNKVTKAIYLEQFFDRSIRESLQYAAVTGTGYLRPCYKRRLYGRGEGNLYLIPYGAGSVLPVQIPANNDLQSAYAVDLVDEMPIAMAHAMFPLYQDRLRPTANSYWYGQSVAAPGNPNMFQRIWGNAQRSLGLGGPATNSNTSELFLPIHYTYVIDLAINNTGNMIPMGEPGTSWYYEVPALNTDISAGRDIQGQQTFRKANEVDARLYPTRRLIIWTEGVVLYDGPSFDWHDYVPAVPLRVDDWPWEGIGYSLVRDGYDQQVAVNELERGAMNITRARLDMPMKYDINAVNPQEAKSFDAYQPAARLGFDGSLGETPFEPVLPPELMDIPEYVFKMMDHLNDSMDYQIGKKDIAALAALRTASPDDMEKIFDVNGPIVKDISRTMERSMRDIGEMTKFLILQYMTVPRVMQYVGEDGITPETFDYDPNSLVPSHLKGEDADGPSGTPRVERARTLARNLRFSIAPNSLHELTQNAHKLMLLQLKRSGFPIDSRTLAEAFNVPNFGNKPDGNTVFERFINEQEQMMELAARAEQLKASLPGLTPIVPPAEGAAPVGNPTSQFGPNGGPLGTGGRAPTAAAMPHMVSKDGGARTTISESK